MARVKSAIATRKKHKKVLTNPDRSAIIYKPSGGRKERESGRKRKRPAKKTFEKK